MGCVLAASCSQLPETIGYLESGLFQLCGVVGYTAVVFASHLLSDSLPVAAHLQPQPTGCSRFPCSTEDQPAKLRILCMHAVASVHMRPASIARSHAKAMAGCTSGAHMAASWQHDMYTGRGQQAARQVHSLSGQHTARLVHRQWAAGCMSGAHSQRPAGSTSGAQTVTSRLHVWCTGIGQQAACQVHTLSGQHTARLVHRHWPAGCTSGAQAGIGQQAACQVHTLSGQQAARQVHRQWPAGCTSGAQALASRLHVWCTGRHWPAGCMSGAQALASRLHVWCTGRHWPARSTSGAQALASRLHVWCTLSAASRLHVWCTGSGQQAARKVHTLSAHRPRDQQAVHHVDRTQYTCHGCTASFS
jgi:hypothetical protein